MDINFNWTERRAAARAWEQGGCLALGLWLSKARPHFTVKQYAEAVLAAREELDDTTDYSAVPPSAPTPEKGGVI